MGRELVEKYFQTLSEALKERAKRVTVDWRSDEALGEIQLAEDFYVFVVISWAGDEYYIEYMVGDENAVISPRHIQLLEEAVAVIKTAHNIASRLGIASH
ncbi:hypothetical protein [Thermoproteus tenax]|uniref:Uncharacterized protein n=1 Tax=Thermoproteus tenax (strain ATCC 35583 / DSM 2078 / JCM 9277 / NBRC 100435 / Kra 1) TaxID=768679 RepID=G4RKQ9_THETK|nr:hypothetical protein [Thermoproteus tenax]CCC82154.1 hypothetical protein TTX_1528 [Thermoproteus tenax Kra 1]